MLHENRPAGRSAAPQAALPAEKRRPADVNPYAQWVHEHPAVLLAEPTPAQLHKQIDANGQQPGGLVVDLGCGSGKFLLEHARRDPHGRYVGFELRFKRLVKAARKVERAGLHNAWFLRESAERLGHYFAPASLQAVHVNFPDPWPRRSDWKKRLLNPALLALLARLLVPGGKFFLRTDHSGYFLHALSLLPDCTGLRVVAYSNDHHRVPAGSNAVRTEFEMLFQSLRKPVYSLVLERPA